VHELANVISFAEAVDRRHVLVGVLRKLPAIQREVLVCRYLLDATMTRRTILVSDTVSFLARSCCTTSRSAMCRTLLAGTRFYGGGHRWSGLDPARLGTRTPWRSAAGGQPGR